jgi:Brp/Blh family beta-carotene 15,15'-monooxygenase
VSVPARPVPALTQRGPAGPVRTTALQDLRLLTWLPVASLATVGGLALVAPAAVAAAAWPLAVTGVVLGVPHGAVDHLVPWWWSSREAPLRRLVVFTAGYAVVAAAAMAAFLIAPVPTVLVFLLLSAVHFGRGEVVAWAERAGRPVPGPSSDVLPAAAAGSAVVGLLLWADPRATAPLLAAVADPLVEVVSDARVVGLAGVAVLVAAAVVRLATSGRRAEAAELALVAAVFAVAPPLAAFGVWFGTWHALRHTGRLLDLARDAEERASGVPTWPAAARRLGRAGWIPSTVALGAVVVLWSLRDVAPLEAQLSVLLALTFPHAAVVWALDRRRA